MKEGIQKRSSEGKESWRLKLGRCSLGVLGRVVVFQTVLGSVMNYEQKNDHFHQRSPVGGLQD